jgi:hypothetical protein
LSLRFNRDTGDDKQALGRSRGGFSSTIVGVCDAAGRLVDFVLVAGQAHELAPSLLLLKRLPKAPAWALADMACDAAEFRSTANAMGAIGRAVTQERQATAALSGLYLPPPQPDRTLLVAAQATTGDRYSL